MLYGFIVQSEMTWNCFQGLHTAATTRDINCVVIVVPQLFDSASIDSTNIKTSIHSRQVLDSMSVPYIDLSEYRISERYQRLLELDCDLLFFSSNIDMFIYETFGVHTETLAQNTKCVYVPYYGATILALDKQHCEEALHVHAWKIISDSPQYTTMLLRSGHSPEKIIDCGHPKIEQLYAVRQSCGKWPLSNSHDKLKVIWSPHWSVTQYGSGVQGWTTTTPNVLQFGTFLTYCENFYQYFATHPGVQCVFRPHPLLQVWLRKHGAHHYFSEWYSRWEKLLNVYNQLSGLYNDTFASSDMLLCDGVSFLTEYPIATGKPLIFIDSGCHVELNELGHIAKDSAIIAKTWSDIEWCLNNPDKLIGNDGSKLLEYLLPHKNNTSHKIVDKLIHQ